MSPDEQRRLAEWERELIDKQAESARELEHFVGPAVVLRLAAGTRDEDPSITIEWQTPPTPGELIILAKELLAS